MTFSRYEKKLLGLLLVVVIVGILLFGDAFVSATTFAIVANQLPEYGLVTLALMLTLIISGMNLSIVSMTTLAGIIGALAMEKFGQWGVVSVLVGLLVMLFIGLLTGAVNGAIVSYLEVSPILTTLGTMLFYQGMALNITKGGAMTSFTSDFTLIGSGDIWGMPIPFIIFIMIVGGLYFLLEKQEFGSQIYRIGKNRHSAMYSGINVKKTVFQVYMLAGLIAGVAAIVMTARYNSIRVDYGATYLINGIVAVSLGGVDIKGGRGSIKGVIIALLIISLLLRILSLAYVDSSLIDGIMGLVLLINIVWQHFSEKPLKVSLKSL